MDYMDRFWIFGGDIFGESGYFNDLFYLDTTQDPLQWVQAFPDGILPEPRDGFTAVTDTQKKKMWIFGGANRTQVMNDVFYIDLTQDRYFESSNAEPGSSLWNAQHSSRLGECGRANDVSKGNPHDGAFRRDVDIRRQPR